MRKSLIATLFVIATVIAVPTARARDNTFDLTSPSAFKLSDLVASFSGELSPEGYVFAYDEDPFIEFHGKNLTPAQVASTVAVTNDLFIKKTGKILATGLAKFESKKPAKIARLHSSKRLSIREMKVNLKRLLKLLAQAYEVNMVVSPKLKGKVSLDVKSASLVEVLEALCQVSDLRTTLCGQVYCMTTKDGRSCKSIAKDYKAMMQKLNADNYITMSLAHFEQMSNNMSALQKELEGMAAKLPDSKPVPRRMGRGRGGWSDADIQADLDRMELKNAVKHTAKQAEACRKRGLKIIGELKKMNELYTSIQRGEHRGSYGVGIWFSKGLTEKERLQALKKKMDEQRAKFKVVGEEYKKLQAKAVKARKDYSSWRNSYRR